MNTLKKLSIPLCLIIAYLTKTIVLTATFADAAILLVLGSVYYINRYFNTKSEITNRELDVKEKVLTENEFRTQVNKDMSELKSNMSNLKFKAGGNPFKQSK